MTEATVLGASGFIGSRLLRSLTAQGISCQAPGRGETLTGKPLGTVFYCIGLTADFRTKPFETVEAHVCKLKHILENCEFDQLVYLSTTRVYANLVAGTEEAALTVSPADPSDLYNLSKLMGESLALNSGRRCKIARLSNVYGDDFESSNFLTSILRDAVLLGAVTLRTSLASAKDYIHIDSVVSLLTQIAAQGNGRIYNVASGVNTTNAELTDALTRLTGASVSVAPDSPTILFPPIRVDAIREEFAARPSEVALDLARLTPLFLQRSRHDTY